MATLRQYDTWFLAGVALLFYGATVSHHLLLPDSAILIDAMRRPELSSNVCSHNLTNLLGWLFQQLPLANLALKGNLVSVFCGAAVIGLFHALLRSLALPRLVAALGALVLMVSHSLWWHSTIVENYALSNVFLVACLLLAVRAAETPRRWYWMCFLAGLALFNHLQNGALAIGLAAFYLACAPRWPGRRWTLLWRGVAFYLLGAAPYFAVLAHDLQRSDDVPNTLHWAVGGGFTTIMFSYDWARALTRLGDWSFQQFPSPFLLFIPLGLIPIVRAFFCSGDLWSPSAVTDRRYSKPLALLLWTGLPRPAVSFGWGSRGGKALPTREVAIGRVLTDRRYREQTRRMISAARTRSPSLCARVTDSRRRAVPSGTVGGRMAMASSPAARSSSASAKARAFAPTWTGMIWLADCITSSPAARSRPRKAAARRSSSAPQPGFFSNTSSAPSAAPTAAGGGAVV